MGRHYCLLGDNGRVLSLDRDVQPEKRIARLNIAIIVELLRNSIAPVFSVPMQKRLFGLLLSDLKSAFLNALIRMLLSHSVPAPPEFEQLGWTIHRG
jgi:hypothetical protein